MKAVSKILRHSISIQSEVVEGVRYLQHFSQGSIVYSSALSLSNIVLRCSETHI